MGMPASRPAPASGVIPSFDSFGPFLRYLRRRVRLTQRELGIAVGYSTPQISLLETGQRLPEPETIAALFVPALALENEPALVVRLLELTMAARSGVSRMTVTRTVRREVTLHEDEVAPAADLPAPLTSFIGRERELADLRALLAEPATRLITLLGPPGVGKTRLAVQLAWERCADFADGACFVDLATVPDPALVASAIRQALAIREPSNPGSEADALKRYLRRRKLLLLLDNCEHVLASGALMADLLSAAPGLKILSTSREPLDVYGEHEYRVAPLAVPAPERLPGLDDLRRIPSVALFVERARAIETNFELTAANAPAIVSICARLDGLPLALELAAARIKQFDPHTLAAHLAQCLSLLERNAPSRGQTVRATVDWSYASLTEGERVLLRRLSVFAGRFSHEAVQAVCGEPGAQGMEDVLPARTTLESLAHLVEKSLLLSENAAGGRRYRLLETIREFAAERLAECGEDESLHRRHTRFFMQLAETAENLIIGADQQAWIERLELEYGNFRAALEWSLAGRAPDLGLRMAAALYRFWWVRGSYSSEGQRWLVRALACDPGGSRPARARALRGLAGLELNQGDIEAACAHYRESLQLFRELGDRKSIAMVMANLGAALPFGGQYAEARANLQESLALNRELGDAFYTGYCLFSLGALAYVEKDYARAQQYSEDARPYFRQVGHQQYMAAVQVQLGMIAAAGGDYEHASTLLRDALAQLRDLKFEIGVLEVLEAQAYVAAAREEPERAAVLLASTDAVRSDRGLHWRLFGTEYQATLSRVASTLDAETLERAWSEGQAMTLEQAIEHALGANG